MVLEHDSHRALGIFLTQQYLPEKIRLKSLTQTVLTFVKNVYIQVFYLIDS
jgi:hypothetical protein